ncbi:transposase [Bacillus massilinigeriensis]|uniref:transposase n=1 Tax=Bacillus massilionigeriensis TaxID=1805475 RepID=UPI00096B25E6|nr:transposase [Bacillus massilionigeriensis]
MPRVARSKSKSRIYHIVMRGINKQTIFEDEEDKSRFFETLNKYMKICKYEIYGYCLMDNHIHLLIKESDETISTIIKRISSSYVYWYNMKYERCGHLFQERFHSENVDSVNYFLTVLRYIHQNPVKAGLVSDVFSCKWTSMKEYLYKPHMVNIDYALQLFSSDRKRALISFKNFMQKPNDDQCLDIQIRVRMSDAEVKRHLHNLGIPNISILQQMDNRDRDAILFKLKGLSGTSLRQLSRITGISKSVIQRAGQRDRYNVPP